MQEALRLFPPVIVVPKTSAEDTTFVVKNQKSGQELRIPVEKGDQIVLHTVGVHYNRKYPIVFLRPARDVQSKFTAHHWDDPTTFRPERFMSGSKWPRDAYVPFSTGTS
jgi:cytochrome P450